MPITEATYRRVALEDPEGHWELAGGRLRSKPGMTASHAYALHALSRHLRAQLDPRVYTLRVNTGRLRISAGTYYIPDLFVIARGSGRRTFEEIPERLEAYDEPQPLVVEVWSPLTGDYDVEEKLWEYQRRRDQEIWRIHPYQRTLTVWRLRPDGSYTELLYRGGAVQPSALPNVTIELNTLFRP